MLPPAYAGGFPFRQPAANHAVYITSDSIFGRLGKIVREPRYERQSVNLGPQFLYSTKIQSDVIVKRYCAVVVFPSYGSGTSRT
jgi:hypothetical protein